MVIITNTNMKMRPYYLAAALSGILFLIVILSCTTRQKRTLNTSLPRPVLDACDAAYAIASITPGVTTQRSTGIFRDEALRQPVLGCHLAISGSFALAPESGDAAERLRRDFGDMGWQNMPRYDADGKDGTRFAFHKEGVTCFFSGEWNGGSDGEPEIPREDWYKVFVLCTSSVSGDNRINADH
jgi:hypothetical protein